MEKTLELANKIMEVANAYTPWVFSVSEQEDSCLVHTAVTNKAGKKLQIVFEVSEDNTGVSVKCSDSFSKEEINYCIRNMKFPVKITIYEQGFMVTAYLPSDEIIKDDCRNIIQNRMEPLMGAVTELIKSK